ncbi:hypothetical protein PN498_25605 [Oscillatoria sp. CS-180]|uniref:hypothetical protein n=1 Tax=Oscillatoria sp. CS-180 TaxID=3021720 RepID=UPI00232B23E3|nr:hypothetical protein [Oscillatoria sp. CS-180]MDB9529393.1 hypothetical protein [Oscillatoria sp. CS-180]
MNTTALYRRPQWLVIGAVIAAAAIGGTVRLLSLPDRSGKTGELTTTEQPAPAPETTTLFESPMITLSTELRKAATPSELVNSTSREERLSDIVTGRVDPFAPITQRIGATTSSQTDEESPSDSTPATAVNPSPTSLPTAPVSSVPNLPPVPVAVPAPQLPSLPPIPVARGPISIPAAPDPGIPQGIPQARPVPQSPVEAVELTGVVQVGDRVGVIVREGYGQTSRHLFEGDLLAGGQVRIKSIDLSSQEPLIILEYQGKEYPRIVG